VSPPPVSKPFAGRPWLLLPFIQILLLGAPTLLYPYGRDQAMFAYVGAVWRHGGLPYRDAWDVKLPGIYAVYALVGGVEWGPRLLDLVAIAVTVGALIRLGRIRFSGGEGASARTALLAAALAVVYSLGACDFWNLAQTETLIAPLFAAAVVCGLSRRHFAAGLLAGCAAMIKTTAVAAIAPVLLCCWLPQIIPAEVAASDKAASGGSWLQRVGRTLLGWLVPLAVVLIYFAARGGLPFLRELVATQREYAAGDPRLSGRSLVALIGGLGLTGYLPLIIASLPGVGRAVVRQLRARRARQMSPEWVLVAWWGIALAQVVVQRRFYLYHWAVLTPPAAWFTAEMITAVWERQSRPPWLRAAAAGVGVLALVTALAPRWPSWRWAGAVLTGAMSVAEFRGRHTGVFGYNVRFAGAAAAHVRRNSRVDNSLLALVSLQRSPGSHPPRFRSPALRRNEHQRSQTARLVCRVDVGRRPPAPVVRGRPRRAARTAGVVAPAVRVDRARLPSGGDLWTVPGVSPGRCSGWLTLA
jgi:hypothetical protein